MHVARTVCHVTSRLRSRTQLTVMNDLQCKKMLNNDKCNGKAAKKSCAKTCDRC